jgi:hypothetical protein
MPFGITAAGSQPPLRADFFDLRLDQLVRIAIDALTLSHCRAILRTLAHGQIDYVQLSARSWAVTVDKNHRIEMNETLRADAEVLLD